jgi:hypothetical protein
MFAESHVVDNRVFLLGLDKLYRNAMKENERGELLTCARRVARDLRVAPADVPIEGYYTEDDLLTEYFRLMRALQEVDESAASAVKSESELQRLLDVTSAPLYGRPQDSGKLLPAGCDPLTKAMADHLPSEWTVANLTATACSKAHETDDISLVGLAAWVEDAVLLTATRESTVLYAAVFIGAAASPPPPRYVWKVDDELAERARRFIDTFNALFGETLPPPDPERAMLYWYAYKDNEILGRCVRLGYDDSTIPIRHYHWAIGHPAYGELQIKEFWTPEVWTTTRYRAALRRGGERPPDYRGPAQK